MGRSVMLLVGVLAVACGDDGAGHPSGTGGGTATGTGSGGSPTGGAGGAGGMGGGGASGGDGGSVGPNPCASLADGATAFDVGGETHCYWMVTSAAPQLQADCGEGAHLATAQSAAEDEHLIAFTSQASPLWIGLRCDAVPPAACTNDLSSYTWMNDEPLGYQGWADGEPAEPRGAAVEPDGWHGYDTLNNSFGYLCEAPAP